MTQNPEGTAALPKQLERKASPDYVSFLRNDPLVNIQIIKSIFGQEQAVMKNEIDSTIEARANPTSKEFPLNQLIQRDVVTTNQSYFTRVAGGFWSTNDKGEIKAHGDFVAVCVEGAINQWKQVPQAKVSEGQDRLDLFAMGVLEKLYPLLGISPQTLAGLQPDRVAAIYKELGTLVDQVETVAAASLFAHWEKHGYPKGVTREMVSQAGTPLAAFKAIYRNGRTSVDLATWDYGQSVGEVMQKRLNQKADEQGREQYQQIGNLLTGERTSTDQVLSQVQQVLDAKAATHKQEIVEKDNQLRIASEMLKIDALIVARARELLDEEIPERNLPGTNTSLIGKITKYKQLLSNLGFGTGIEDSALSLPAVRLNLLWTSLPDLKLQPIDGYQGKENLSSFLNPEQTQLIIHLMQRIQSLR